MTPDTSGPRAGQLADLARAVKAGARAVTLYPAAHPAIKAAMRRVVTAGARLAEAGPVTLVVHPDRILIDDWAPPRPDAAVGELAHFLHARLIGSLRFERTADAADWHALLLLLSRAPEDLRAEGGIARLVSASDRPFDVTEIDYAEVLRERTGGGTGDGAKWAQIIANCLRGRAPDLDDRARQSLRDMIGDPARFGGVLAQFQEGEDDAAPGTRAGALLRVLQDVADHTAEDGQAVAAMFQTVADAASRLTPDMVMALVECSRENDDPGLRQTAAEIVSRITDRTVATLVATTISEEQGATARLAQVLETLVPDPDRQREVLETARSQAASRPTGQDPGLQARLEPAAEMLLSYSDREFVGPEYAAELSQAHTHAVHIDQVSDDPPERVQAWLGSVVGPVVDALDRQLLLDLLPRQSDPEAYGGVLAIVVAEVERLVLAGDADDAEPLLAALVRETAQAAPGPHQAAATAALRQAGDPLVRHVLLQLQTAGDGAVPALTRLCHVLGPLMVGPLADALMTESNERTLRRLHDLLLGFGTVGTHVVEQLKTSANPAVRRRAIELLRELGGRDSLSGLASMLDDAEPHVQREAVRAIVQIGTADSHAVLERALTSGNATARETICQYLITLRGNAAVPLLCHVLNHTEPRGRLLEVHFSAIETLGGLASQPASLQTLRSALLRGTWWTPLRTARLRRAAAAALRRLASADAYDQRQRPPGAGQTGRARGQVRP